MQRIFRLALVLTLFCFAIPVSAQTRSRMSVYVPTPTGGTADQRAYFQEAFKTELIGANYPSVETRQESAFTLVLIIQDDPYFDPRYVMDVDNQPYILGIKLERSGDNAELVSFEFSFSDTESMANWNLFLLYQAMANASVDDLPEEENDGESQQVVSVVQQPPETIYLSEDDRWWRKGLYIIGGLGMDMGYFLLPGTFVTDLGYALPMAQVGLEWHFLPFLSLEAAGKARFMHNKQDYFFAPGAAAVFKGVLTPGSIMLELYGGAEYNLALPPVTIPWLSAVAGLQVATRGGERLGFTLDFNVSYSLLGTMSLQDDDISYNTIKFSILGGFKIGFGDLR
jgi:hypothetical protein